MPPRRLAVCTILVPLLGAIGAALSAQHPAVPVPSALEPAATGGLSTLDLALAKLATHRRVLIVGAHPDDEDNSLLTLVARGMGGEAAYLSLSRGEGGQNLVGTELGVELGVLRTGELLAAREIDGGRQFFTRAYDFGYTRSLEETLERWPREVLREDAVRVVRRFRPQVVVAIFPPDERARHGQHQASAVIAEELMELAGEPDRFSDLTAGGLGPWRPTAFYRRTWWAPEEATLWLPLGGIEPLSGRSMRQIAAASRSMHRSQDMGRMQEVGPARASFAWVAGGAGASGSDLFSGVDTRLAAIVSTLPESGERERAAAALARVEALARGSRERLTPADPAVVVPALGEILSLLVRTREDVEAMAAPVVAARAVAELLQEKIEIAEAALAAASGIVVDAVTDRERVALGEEVLAAVRVWNAGTGSAVVRAIDIVAAEGWRPELSSPPEITSASSARTASRLPRAEAVEAGDPTVEGAPVELGPGQLGEWSYSIGVDAGAAPTVPYFLERPKRGDLYDWGSTPPETRGEPYQPPPLVCRFELLLEGLPVTLEREVVHRYGDQAFGEVRRPIRAVPALQVAVEPDLLVWPVAGGETRELEVALSSTSASPLSGRVRVRPPWGWPEIDPVAFTIEEPGGRRRVQMTIEPPAPFPPGAYELRVEALLDEGTAGSLSFPLLDHPHVRPAATVRSARVAVRAVDLELPRLGRIGYVRGASDRVPETLVEIGLPVELLGPRTLIDGDLSDFEVIVIGSRAYETDPALARANPRLLDYARAGGTLLVQYQQYQFVRGGYAPFELEIARPHDRVTDESSPVEVLVPEHPVFRRPNAIAEADWRDWVQERGLYFAHAWGEPYAPLLELRDPGMPPQRGALLVAELGDGTYVYTGLSFFRELPAGVPGAYRLFANLLALGEPEGSREVAP